MPSALPARSLGDLILRELMDAPSEVLTVSQLAAAAGEARCSLGDVEDALAELEQAGRIYILRRPPPDPHLGEFDLRIVCPMEDSSPTALRRAEDLAQARWDEFVRQFLVSRRCC